MERREGGTVRADSQEVRIRHLAIEGVAPRGWRDGQIVPQFSIGAMAFPPTMMLLPIAHLLAFEPAGDLTIAADGMRVRNHRDYHNEMRDVQPGEIVYLTMIRNGVRKQVPVPIPDTRN
jgi:S1-C subfamily serine protease